MPRLHLLTVIVLLLVPLRSGVAQRFVFEGSLGVAYNVRTPLHVEQTNQPDIDITARYSTRPFSASPYYQIQFGLWNKEQTAGWVLGLLHHKIYLENPPPEIQFFEVTYGYNTLYIGRAWRKKKHWIVSLGAGALIANPLTSVRNQVADLRGEFLTFGWAGATIYGALQRRLQVNEHLFFGVETKLTASMAWIPVAEGSARVPNVALHLQGSLGLGF